MADNVNKLYESLSKQLNMPPGQIKSAASEGNAEALLKNADPDAAKRVSEVLSDPEKTKRLLVISGGKKDI